MSHHTSRLRQLRNINTLGLEYRLVDAKDQVVGRLAAQLSILLQGKDKPHFTPSGDVGDVVVVKNAGHAHFTGKKWENKLYQWHTGYPGGIKERSARAQHLVDPVSVLWKAVRGMLPKNKLRESRMCKLVLYPGEEHEVPDFTPSGGLIPWEMPPRKLQRQEGPFELPADFLPLNRPAYKRRFGHMLPQQQLQQLQLLPPASVSISARQQ